MHYSSPGINIKVPKHENICTPSKSSGNVKKFIGKPLSNDLKTRMLRIRLFVFLVYAQFADKHNQTRHNRPRFVE